MIGKTCFESSFSCRIFLSIGDQLSVGRKSSQHAFALDLVGVRLLNVSVTVKNHISGFDGIQPGSAIVI
jgi:hypothetical protein